MNNDLPLPQTSATSEGVKAATWNDEESSERRRRVVLAVSILIGLALIGWVLVDVTAVSAATVATKQAIMDYLDRPLMVLNTFFVIIALVFLIGPWGRVRLGSDDSRPALATRTWLFMMFAAGIGAGIVFWAAAEPLFHEASGLFDASDPMSTPADKVLAAQLFSYGFHSWACYSMIGIAIGYFGFRKGMPLTFSSAVGRGLDVVMSGKAVGFGSGLGDLLAIFGMLFGIGGSVAAGTLQISSGFMQVTGMTGSISGALAVCVLLSILGVSLLVSISGSDRGLALASNINIFIAIGLMLFIFFASDVALHLERLWHLVFNYPLMAVEITKETFVGPPSYREWIRDWPITYFLWSMSWSPFVGAFIAEISRGRTIRQTLLGALIFPTIFSGIWFTIVGGWSLEADKLSGGLVSQAVQEDVSQAVFYTLRSLPFSEISLVVGVVLAGIFLVTTCAAGILILSVISTGKEKPGRMHQIFWAGTMAAVAVIVVVSNKLDVIRAVPIFAAVPIAILGVVAVSALIIDVMGETREDRDSQGRLQD